MAIFNIEDIGESEIMMRIIASFSLVGMFSFLGYICLQDPDRVSKREIPVSYLKPEINSSVKVYKVPIIKVNGEIIGDYDAAQIAYQKGVGFIEENGATREKN